ncbi:MAG: hypothetical protein ACE5D3_02360 [Candidatus Binatia bacterium]
MPTWDRVRVWTLPGVSGTTVSVVVRAIVAPAVTVPVQGWVAVIVSVAVVMVAGVIPEAEGVTTRREAEIAEVAMVGGFVVAVRVIGTAVVPVVAMVAVAAVRKNRRPPQTGGH